MHLLLTGLCCTSSMTPLSLHNDINKDTYRTRAIITRGLYTFYPIFEGQKRLFKELFFVKF